MTLTIIVIAISSLAILSLAFWTVLASRNRSRKRRRTNADVLYGVPSDKLFTARYAGTKASNKSIDGANSSASALTASHDDSSWGVYQSGLDSWNSSQDFSGFGGGDFGGGGGGGSYDSGSDSSSSDSSSDSSSSSDSGSSSSD